MDGLNHNSGQNAGKEEHVPADLSLHLPDDLRELSHDLNTLAREDGSLANSIMLDRIANASWSTTTLKFQGQPVIITRPQVARSSSHAMRLAAAVAILATGVAAFFALRSTPITSNSPSVIAKNNSTKPPTQTLAAEQAQIESDLALLDDIWGTSDSSTSSVTSDLWASASQIETSVSTDALEELFSTEESMQ